MSKMGIGLVVLALVIVGIVVVAVYLPRRSACTADSTAVRGDVRREKGQMIYYDGRCWTQKPVPPTDTPF